MQGMEVERGEDRDVDVADVGMAGFLTDVGERLGEFGRIDGLRALSFWWAVAARDRLRIGCGAGSAVMSAGARAREWR